ncbi:MAG: deoxyribodipyrimidine photo-lyase [Pseudomonadota bacterium]
MFYICSMSGLHITWFRQDLRVHDHAALRAACQSAEREGGQVLALYVLPNASGEDLVASAHPTFLMQALSDLRGALFQREAVLHLRQGDALEILSELHKKHRILSLHSHETWPADPKEKATEAWALRAGVQFRLHPQFDSGAAPRGHESWQTVWERFMARPRNEAPDLIPSANVGMGRWPDELDAESSRGNTGDADASLGGRKHAIKQLRRFLGTGAEGQPNLQSGQAAFARLKPHLMLGTVSPREVWQAAVGAHQQALKAGLDIRAASIASFLQLLPTLSQKRTHMQTQKGRPVAISGARNSADSGQQLSLGLGDSGQS